MCTKVQVDSLAVKPNHPKIHDFSGAIAWCFSYSGGILT